MRLGGAWCIALIRKDFEMDDDFRICVNCGKYYSGGHVTGMCMSCRQEYFDYGIEKRNDCPKCHAELLKRVTRLPDGMPAMETYCTECDYGRFDVG